MPQFCSECGKQNSDKAKFCNECGEPLTQETQRKLFLLDNRYEILENIKSGAMGSIFKAKDHRLGITVAIKKMLDFFDDEKERKYAERRFIEEARLLSQLHHSGLPKVSDFFSIPEPPGNRKAYYLVMTFIEGKDLSDIMIERRYKPLPVDLALVYFRQMLDILAYLHSRVPPIVYRDMKPSNVMVKEKKLYLVDFGIAKIINSTRAGTLIGTPGYAAPEQYKGFSDARSDIYSLGAVMHFLLTGINPEEPGRPPFTFEPIIGYNPSVPEYLLRIIEAMVEFQSDKRPGSAQEILQMLEAEERVFKNKMDFSPITSQGTSFEELLADRYLQSGDLEKAEEIYIRLRNARPDDLELSLTLGKIYVQLNKLGEAESEFRKILRRNPNHENALFELGKVCLNRGFYRDAIQFFNKVLKNNPQHAGAKEKLGDVYFAEGRVDYAVEFYMQAARIYRFSDDSVDLATVLFQKVLKLDPHNKGAIQELTNMGVQLSFPGIEKKPSISATTTVTSVFDVGNSFTARRIYKTRGVHKFNEVKWKFRTGGAVLSTPLIGEGIIYFGCYDKFFYAVNAMTGTETWRFRTADCIYSSPLLYEGVIYFGCFDGHLYAISLRGNLQWKFRTEGKVYSSPVISDGVIYFGSEDSHLYALNIKTGFMNWKFKAGDAILSSPAVADNKVIFGCQDSYVYAIDKITGREIWRFKTGDIVDSSPAIFGDAIFIGSKDFYLYALHLKTGSQKWKFRTGKGITSSPAIIENTVYFGSYDQYFYAVDAANGREKWKFYTGDWIDTSPAIAGGIVYFAGRDTYLYALDMKTGQEKWRFKTGGYMSSSPAVDFGVVYIGSHGRCLYALT